MKKFLRMRLRAKEFVFSGDKTEYDPQLQVLIMHVDRTSALAKGLTDGIREMVGPNTKKMNSLEELGHNMHQAGSHNSMATSQYGTLLVKVGEHERQLGYAEKEFVLSVHSKCITPMLMYLKQEFKEVDKERSLLEKKRLDLDICKNAERQATTNDKKISLFQKVKLVQTEFDRQSEILQMVLERVARSHDQHVNHLKDLVHLQSTYFKKCHKILVEPHHADFAL